MKGICLLIITLLLSLYTRCQETGEEILMTIGHSPVTLSEFERIYKKNNTGNNVLDKKPVDEYLELFINFKLNLFLFNSLLYFEFIQFFFSWPSCFPIPTSNFVISF